MGNMKASRLYLYSIVGIVCCNTYIMGDITQLGRTHFIIHDALGEPNYSQYSTAPAHKNDYNGAKRNCNHANTRSIEAFFSTHDNLRDQLCTKIRNEQKQVDLAAYVFNDKQVAQEMLDATKRGVRIRMVVDKQVMTGNASKIDMLSDCPNVSIYAYNPPKKGAYTSLMHNKFVLFHAQSNSGPSVWTGSANLTKQALDGKNQENVIFFSDCATHQAYLNYFEELIDIAKKQADRNPIR